MNRRMAKFVQNANSIGKSAGRKLAKTRADVKSGKQKTHLKGSKSGGNRKTGSAPSNDGFKSPNSGIPTNTGAAKGAAGAKDITFDRGAAKKPDQAPTVDHDGIIQDR